MTWMEGDHLLVLVKCQESKEARNPWQKGSTGSSGIVRIMSKVGRRAGLPRKKGTHVDPLPDILNQGSVNGGFQSGGSSFPGGTKFRYPPFDLSLASFLPQFYLFLTSS